MELDVGLGVLLLAAAVVGEGLAFFVVGGDVDGFWSLSGWILGRIIILGVGLIFLILHVLIF